MIDNRDNPDYLTHRQPVIEEESRDVMNAWIRKMLSFFRPSFDIWVEKSCNVEHPIAKIWKRKDAMATNELVNFARAVDIMDRIDGKWTSNTMKVVAGKDVNNARGAIFEIIALSLFADDADCTIIPMNYGHPGIDGVLQYSNGTRMNLSLKNYGTSYQEKEFRNLMKDVYRYYQTGIKKRKLISSQIVLSFSRYPERRESGKVKKLVDQALDIYSRYYTQGIPVLLKDELVNITVNVITGYNLCPFMQSNKFISVSPFHKNEYKNLRDKLDDDCLNLEKQKKTEEDDEYNCIMIHLHEDADIDSYHKELQDYITDNPDKPITYILLYQPVMAENEEGRTSVINNMWLHLIIS